MRISFFSVGKPHEAYVRAGIEDFTSRIGHYFGCEWKVLPPARNTRSGKNSGAAGNGGPAGETKKQEAETILNALNKEDYLVLLDERGKQWTSEQLAAFLQTRANDSCRHLVFLIGGAFGVDAAVQARAQYTWSLSNLVFPHQLVRLILSEQVYRACTILRNEKYHHQ
jgi:23S rRNA (pseudouridine1915-N3)-methyltransferase